MRSYSNVLDGGVGGVFESMTSQDQNLPRRNALVPEAAASTATYLISHALCKTKFW